MMAEDRSTPPTPLDRLAAAFVDLIGEAGWSRATLAEAAARSGVPLAGLALEGGGRFDLLDAFGRHLNAQALADAEAEGGSQAARDRLFALLMVRFDALQPHRAGVAALQRAARSDPGLGLFFACRLPRALALLVEAAGVATAGPRGAVRVAAVTAAYLGTVRVWLHDDSADMAATMAALDKGLARLSRLL